MAEEQDPEAGMGTGRPEPWGERLTEEEMKELERYNEILFRS